MIELLMKYARTTLTDLQLHFRLWRIGNVKDLRLICESLRTFEHLRLLDVYLSLLSSHRDVRREGMKLVSNMQSSLERLGTEQPDDRDQNVNLIAELFALLTELEERQGSASELEGLIFESTIT